MPRVSKQTKESKQPTSSGSSAESWSPTCKKTAVNVEADFLAAPVAPLTTASYSHQIIQASMKSQMRTGPPPVRRPLQEESITFPDCDSDEDLCDGDGEPHFSNCPCCVGKSWF